MWRGRCSKLRRGHCALGAAGIAQDLPPPQWAADRRGRYLGHRCLGQNPIHSVHCILLAIEHLVAPSIGLRVTQSHHAGESAVVYLCSTIPGYRED